MSEKIPCYILCYNEFLNFRTTFEYLQKIDSFVFHIIENASKYSRSHFLPYIQAKIESGEIASHYFFEQNITTNAYDTVFKLQIVTNSTSDSKYIMITDGDIMPLCPWWLEEEIEILERYPVVMCVSLQFLQPYFESIRFPPEHPLHATDRIDYTQQLAGWWGTLYRAQEFYSIVHEFIQTGRKVYDWHFQLWSAENNRHMALTKIAKAIHLTEYNYLDETDAYGKTRKQQGNEIWLQNTYSSFTYTTKGSCVRYTLCDNINFVQEILY